MHKTKVFLLASAFVFLLPLTLLAAANSSDSSKTEPPPIIPEFINETADKQIATWEKFFGDDWQTVLAAVEASQTGDVEGFVRGGLKLVVITPRLLPRVGIDLIFPIDENYDGPLLVDPNREEIGVEISGHYFQIKDVQDLASLSVEDLALSLLVEGYNSEHIVIKKLFQEDALELVADEVTARTNLPLKLDNQKIYVLAKDKKEEKKLKALPAQAEREVETRYRKFNTENISLEIKDNKAVYVVDGQIDGRILYIIPIKFDVSATYDAEKSSLDKVDKPWWEIFVF